MRCFPTLPHITYSDDEVFPHSGGSDPWMLLDPNWRAWRLVQAPNSASGGQQYLISIIREEGRGRHVGAYGHTFTLQPNTNQSAVVQMQDTKESHLLAVDLRGSCPRDPIGSDGSTMWARRKHTSSPTSPTGSCCLDEGLTTVIWLTCLEGIGRRVRQVAKSQDRIRAKVTISGAQNQGHKKISRRQISRRRQPASSSSSPKGSPPVIAL